MANSFLCRYVLILVSLVCLNAFAKADDASSIAVLEKQAIDAFLKKQYGLADEKIRAAISSADNDTFMRLALLQGLIATHMGGDGRRLMGAALAAHQSSAWPQPIIAYLLGDRKLQQVADNIRFSGISREEKQRRVCELSFFAGAFAARDGHATFAEKLFDKAETTCGVSPTFLALTSAERTLSLPHAQ